MDELSSPTLRLSQTIGQRWRNIETARALSLETLAKLREVCSDLDSEDASIVVLGSLGRREYTNTSDIDWNLLVDGIADPTHYDLFVNAKKRIGEIAAKEVGREQTFGSFVSSHDLIHNIGGEDDTNRNLTRRLLLLLESAPIGPPITHQRVVKNILKRYLLDDRSFWTGTSVHKHHIPHFLLNDFARFWRTMAVDFAYKRRARSGEGWAMRNIKLRMSRKLLYVAGLLGCFYWHLNIDVASEDRDAAFVDEDIRPEIIDISNSVFSKTPLDIVAAFLQGRKHLQGITSKLFQAYDDFLGILLDDDERQHLEKLPEGSGDSDPSYRRAREISHRFRDALLALFFDDETELGQLTRLYGVF